jgi:hypothetical protein
VAAVDGGDGSDGEAAGVAGAVVVAAGRVEDDALEPFGDAAGAAGAAGAGVGVAAVWPGDADGVLGAAGAGGGAAVAWLGDAAGVVGAAGAGIGVAAVWLGEAGPAGGAAGFVLGAVVAAWPAGAGGEVEAAPGVDCAAVAGAAARLGAGAVVAGAVTAPAAGADCGGAVGVAEDDAVEGVAPWLAVGAVGVAGFAGSAAPDGARCAAVEGVAGRFDAGAGEAGGRVPGSVAAADGAGACSGWGTGADDEALDPAGGGVEGVCPCSDAAEEAGAADGVAVEGEAVLGAATGKGTKPVAGRGGVACEAETRPPRSARRGSSDFSFQAATW